MALLDSAGIKKFQQFILFGEKVVRETVHALPDLCVELVRPQSFAHGLLRPPPHLKLFDIAKPLFRQLDVFGTHFPLLICRTPPVPPLDLAEPPQGLEILCPASDPSNLGALVRSCQAFGADKLILLEEASSPFLPKAVRAASGAVLLQPLFRGPSIKSLSCAPHAQSIVALGLNGRPLSDYQWPEHARLLLGQEGPGLAPHSFSMVLTIPMKTNSNSLNIVVAAGIALYAYRLQHSLSAAKRGSDG